MANVVHNPQMFGEGHPAHRQVAPHTALPSKRLDLLVADLTLAGVAVSTDPVMDCNLRSTGQQQ